MTAAVLSGLGVAVSSDVLTVAPSLVEANAADIRDLLLDAAPMWLDSALDMATGVAYDMYDTARVAAGVSSGYDFIIRDAPSRDAEMLARWAVKPAFEPGTIPGSAVDSVLARVADAVADEAVSAAREAQVLTGVRDTAVRGFKRYAKYDACSFCKMLETRGGVYHSRKSAGEWNKFHSNCSCAVVAAFK